MLGKNNIKNKILLFKIEEYLLQVLFLSKKLVKVLKFNSYKNSKGKSFKKKD